MLAYNRISEHGQPSQSKAGNLTIGFQPYFSLKCELFARLRVSNIKIIAIFDIMRMCKEVNLILSYRFRKRIKGEHYTYKCDDIIERINFQSSLVYKRRIPQPYCNTVKGSFFVHMKL